MLFRNNLSSSLNGPYLGFVQGHSIVFLGHRCLPFQTHNNTRQFRSTIMFDSFFLSTNFSYFLVSICFYRRAYCVFPQVNYFHATFMARSISFSEGRAFLSIQYSTVKHIIARFCGLFMCPRFDASDSLYLNSNGQRLTLNNSNTLAGMRESGKALSPP